MGVGSWELGSRCRSSTVTLDPSSFWGAQPPRLSFAAPPRRTLLAAETRKRQAGTCNRDRNEHKESQKSEVGNWESEFWLGHIVGGCSTSVLARQQLMPSPKSWLLAFKLKLTPHPGPLPVWQGEGVKLQLVVTTALILAFSPKRRDSDSVRLFTRLCVVRIRSRVLSGSGVQGASLLGGNLRTRGSREQRKPFLPRLGERAGVRAGFKPKLNCISEFSDRSSFVNRNS